jgi:predicted O-linked N-acetylglucosamine transferase (SPINDLY family)
MSPGWDYYACLQYSKKLHPDFHVVLGGLLKSNPLAKVLLLSGSRVFSGAFKDVAGFTDEMLGRLVFVPRMRRDELLGILGGCKAFLGTYPWGEGVTSLEALSVDLPVVVMPGKVVVEQLAMGQLRVLGLEKTLAAGGEEEYVEIARRLGRDELFREGVKGWIKAQKWRLFGEEALEEVAKEWEGWLKRVVGRGEAEEEREMVEE